MTINTIALIVQVCMTSLFLGIKSTIPTGPPPSSNCQDCKSVSGSGPLTGKYFLVEGENQESLCTNHCVYMKKGDDDEDRYCFVIQDGPYTTTECDKVRLSTLNVVFISTDSYPG